MAIEEGNKLIKAKPFLKWAGGKRALLKDLKMYAPKKYNTYYEPFCGGAALFFSLQPDSAVLADKNKELINCYKQIKKVPLDVIEILKTMKYEKKMYYEIRAEIPKESIRRAARLIYLNRCCWNGLWRVNSKGEFNVPFGKYENPTICDKDVLINASNVLKRTRILTGDFALKVKDAKSGDFVYFDPPYTVKQNNGFLMYNERIFSWKDQNKLALCAKKLVDKGVYVMISNANHDDIKDLYPGFSIHDVSRTSTISGKGKGRGKVIELIIKSY